MLIILSPIPLVIGTQNNYWNQGSYYLGIELIAGFVLLGVVSTRTWIPFASATALAVLVSVLAHWGLSRPYLAPGPITQADAGLNIPGWGKILVYQSQKDAFGPVVEAIKANTDPSDKLFDASGDLPIVSLLADRPPSGAPWTLGGHTGFIGATVKELDAVSKAQCLGSSRLIVLSTGRPTDLRVKDVSQKFGLVYPDDFSRVFADQTFSWPPMNIYAPLAVDLSKRPFTCPLRPR